MAENSNIQSYALAFMVGSGSGYGVNQIADSGNDIPVTSTSIQDCTPFSQHAREHEQHKCQALINSIKLDCKD